MSKEWHFRIRDMLDCIGHLERLLAKQGSDSVRDLDTYRAVERNLEIIAEASKYLSDDLKSRYPSLPWKQILNMRNVIAHDYGAVDENLIWLVVRDKIPELKIVLLDMLEKYPDHSS